MNRPSISLTLIAKNEEQNIPALFQSVEGCFDEIIFVDTGSTDKTIEVAKEWASKINTKLNLQTFEWVNDFSEARNYAKSFVTTDFWAWLDLDDCLVNKEAFIKWRDHSMEYADYWLATYDYATNEKNEVVCSFARERVHRTSKNGVWKYFIHEGIAPVENSRTNYITTWKVRHRRTAADLEKDKSRNLNIFEKKKAYLDSRMLFYYGKELFEARKNVKACEILAQAITKPDLQLHDRILAMQYACYSYSACNDHETALQIAHQAILLDPKRAEFWCIIGDCYALKNQFSEALPAYAAAKSCALDGPQGSAYAGPIFTNSDAYDYTPSLNIAKCQVRLGKIKEAKETLTQLAQRHPKEEVFSFLNEVGTIQQSISFEQATNKTEDIVISCPPGGAYPWDEELYKNKGMGGSETAAIEMAKRLKKKTGRPVKVFNTRSNELISESGVEYLSNSRLNDYFSKNIPKVHVAWRHNIKVTNAKTYAWCHDLFMPSAEVQQNFDKMICLTNFHANYVSSLQGVPKEKMFVAGNGITSDRFHKATPVAKDPNKIVWLSSPDRGLDRSMRVLDLVRKEFPDIKLHVFYGLDNLYKYGLAKQADDMKQMMLDRKDWVTYHGFTEQNKMVDMVKDASIWLHPSDFIESYCITALEAACSGIYTVTRRFGALAETAGQFEKLGMATLLDHDCITQEQHENYAKEVINALKEKKWERVKVSPDQYDWDVIADQWIKEMNL